MSQFRYNTMSRRTVSNKCFDCGKILSDSCDKILLKCLHRFCYDCFLSNILLDVSEKKEEEKFEKLSKLLSSCPGCDRKIKLSYFTTFNTETVMEKNHENCSVCLEEYGYIMNIAETNCGHKFHYDCITSWIKSDKKSCPLCRTDLSVEFIEKLEEHQYVKQINQISESQIQELDEVKIDELDFLPDINTEPPQLPQLEPPPQPQITSIEEDENPFFPTFDLQEAIIDLNSVVVLPPPISRQSEDEGEEEETNPLIPPENMEDID